MASPASEPVKVVSESETKQSRPASDVSSVAPSKQQSVHSSSEAETKTIEARNVKTADAEQTSATEKSATPTTANKRSDSTKRQLGLVKSLESYQEHSSSKQSSSKITSSSKNVSQQQQQPKHKGQSSQQASTSGQQQQKQMFSLKQLAINSKNLAKKRATNSQRQQSATVLPQNSNSSSNSSRENSVACEATSGAGNVPPHKRRISNPDQVPLPNGDESDLDGDYYDLTDDDDDDYYYDEDGDDDDDDYYFGSDSDQDSGGNNPDDRKRNKRCQRASFKSRNRRRPSNCGCNCELLVNKIDFDGLQITDVDLITYKDLCQIEQKVQQMMRLSSANAGQTGANQSSNSKLLDSHSVYQLNLSAQNSFAPNSLQLGPESIRRSSLQEESNAYYELCLSNDELEIREKYAWFPPSLKQSLKLVDKFFESFPKARIPYSVKYRSNHSTGRQQSLTKKVDNQTPAGDGGKQASNKTAAAATKPASDYRDEQISFQLPSQDVSLDHCQYPMSESAKLSFNSFVEKRNNQALDVGTVIQFRLINNQLAPVFNLNQLNKKSAAKHSQSGSQTPHSIFGTTSHQQSHQIADLQNQRKASTVSQSAVALLALQQQQQRNDQSNLSALQSGSNSSGFNQRCRRCLVRFENDQLAVMAPNFIIGSTMLYKPTTSTIISSASTKGNSQRRASSSSAYQQPQLSKSSLVSEAAQRRSASNAALFHPACFTCSTCKEFLVDLVYCLRDNKLYCLRHYGDSLRPRCSWCQEVSLEPDRRRVKCV